MAKPIFPNNSKIKNIKIKYRIFENDDVEIYETEGGGYLYLLLKQDNISSSKKKKYKVFEVKIKNKNHLAFVLEDNHQRKINAFIKSLTELSGFDAVAGMRDLKIQLTQDVINPILQKDKYKKFKLSIPNGILLYGPPGCGKTYIVKKLAEEINFNFIEVKHSDVASTYQHGTVEKIAKVFKEAKQKKPSLLFIDELDGLMPKRDSSMHTHKLEEINEFLTHLNNAGKEDILVVGATNQLELIDDAILRSGRFDKKFFVMPPDFEARKNLFLMYLEGRPIQDIDYNLLAKKTDNYSCSDIEMICNEAARLAVFNDINFITTEIILDVIENTQSSINSSSQNKIGFGV